MAWKIKYSPQAIKSLKKLDKPVARKILDTLDEIAQLSNPRTRGKGLSGNLSGLWRYRIGNYRVIVRLEDKTITMYALQIAHRSTIYKK